MFTASRLLHFTPPVSHLLFLTFLPSHHRALHISFPFMCFFPLTSLLPHLIIIQCYIYHIVFLFPLVVHLTSLHLSLHVAFHLTHHIFVPYYTPYGSPPYSLSSLFYTIPLNPCLSLLPRNPRHPLHLHPNNLSSLPFHSPLCIVCMYVRSLALPPSLPPSLLFPASLGPSPSAHQRGRTERTPVEMTDNPTTPQTAFCCSRELGCTVAGKSFIRLLFVYGFRRKSNGFSP